MAQRPSRVDANKIGRKIVTTIIHKDITLHSQIGAWYNCRPRVSKQKRREKDIDTPHQNIRYAWGIL